MASEQVFAFILAVTEIGKEYEVVNMVKEIASEIGVEARVFVVYGEYDVVIEIVSDSLRKIDKIVTMIRALEGILRTVTLISAE